MDITAPMLFSAYTQSVPSTGVLPPKVTATKEQ